MVMGHDSLLHARLDVSVLAVALDKPLPGIAGAVAHLAHVLRDEARATLPPFRRAPRAARDTLHGAKSATSGRSATLRVMNELKGRGVEDSRADRSPDADRSR
jgi:hypothetical protein